jgi:hypothetical protein
MVTFHFMDTLIPPKSPGRPLVVVVEESGAGFLAAAARGRINSRGRNNPGDHQGEVDVAMSDGGETQVI